MTETRGPKNDPICPTETTTLLLGAMAPEDSQLALNFGMIFPGAQRVIPVVNKKSKRPVPHNDVHINKSQKTTEEKAAEMIAEELKAERTEKRHSHQHHRHKEHKKSLQHHTKKLEEQTKQALSDSEAAPQAGK